MCDKLFLLKTCLPKICKKLLIVLTDIRLQLHDAIYRLRFYSKSRSLVSDRFETETTTWLELKRISVRSKFLVGEGVVDGEGGSSEGCLKWGGGGWGSLRDSFQKHLKTGGG